MTRSTRARALTLLLTLTAVPALAGPTFVCQEPGGKRLVEIQDADIGPVDGKIALRIDPEGYINDRDGKHVLFVSDDDVRPTPTGLKLMTFDGDDFRHAAGGKVVLNYTGKEICPSSSDNRIYSIEGDALSKRQFIAAMYLLKPELFKLTAAEEAEQKKDRADAAAEQDKLDHADIAAGTYQVLNSNGVAEKLGKGNIAVAAKLGDAYPVTLDFTPGGGPSWTGVACVGAAVGDKVVYLAYGTPKTTAIGVYEINGGTLTGTWHPWYNDGTPKTVGTETLTGPANLSGTYKIAKAAAPGTGQAYTGTVTITPMKITGATKDAMPYAVTWTFGKVVVKGIGIRSGDTLVVASGTGADVCVAKWTVNSGTANSEWFKLGSNEMGNAAVMKN